MLDLIKTFPESPGVYLMKNQKGQVLYVGKAINLRRRVSSYFISPDRSKTKKLAEKVKDIEIVLVHNEREALLTEFNLIKKHNPPFNIKLKNKGSYPFIYLDKSKDFPFFQVSSKIDGKNILKFGPYPFYDSAREVADFLNDAYGLRTCSDNTLKHRSRPCILFNMKKCSAPCTKEITKKDYDKNVKDAIKSFNADSIKKRISDEESLMKRCAEEEKFEEANRHKKAWLGWKKIGEKQSVVDLNQQQNFVYVDLITEGSYDHLVALEFKQGAFWGVTKSLMVHEAGESNLLSFSLNWDKSIALVSPKDLNTLKEMDYTILSLPKKNMDYLNSLAEENIKRSKDQEVLDSSGIEIVSKELNISKLDRIECYDISHLQGSNQAGSRVVWENGFLRKSLYRNYKIQHQQGNNDFLSLQEVIKRRLNDQEDPLPDVLLIDGGRPQIQAVEKVIQELNIQGVKTWGIAKARVQGSFQDTEVVSTEERLITESEELVLKPGTLSYKLITNLRNEAHRFALRYHRKLRSKNLIKKP